MNLFLSTRRLTGALEDHLTEFFAAALTLNTEFRQAYADLVLGKYAEARGWNKPEIQKVETQVSCGKGCMPDMILELKDGHKIICEHKLEAPETMGVTEEIEDLTPQLERYLSLNIGSLMYVRSYWKPPVEKILIDSKYIKPEGREHFLWRDFYSLLERYDDQFMVWLREGFEELGFTPPHPIIGDLNDRDRQTWEKNRRNFAKFWTSTKSLARQWGWKPTAGSISELYLDSNRNKMAREIFISPNFPERFLFRGTPASPEVKDVLLRRILSVAETLPMKPQVRVTVAKGRKGGPVEVINVVTTLHKLIDGTDKPEEIEKRLCDFVGKFLKQIGK